MTESNYPIDPAPFLDELAKCCLRPGRACSTDALAAYNARCGFHFFSDGAKKFFASRISDRAALPVSSGWVFVTSEKFDYKSPRLYTVRVLAFDGRVNTIGEFQQYKNISAAWRAAEHYAKQNKF